MAGSVIEIDDKFLKRLEQAETRLTRIAESADKMTSMVSNAFNSISSTNMEMLNKVAQGWAKLATTKLSINADTSSVEKFGAALDEVTRSVQEILRYRQDANFELFDPRDLYATDEFFLDIKEKLSEVEDKMSEVEQQFKEFGTDASLLRGFEASVQFEAPINPKTEKAFGKNSKAYKDALAAFEAENKAKIEAEEEAFREERRIKEIGERADVELELRSLQNEKRILQSKLKYAQMTELERAKFVEDALSKLTQKERAHINSVRSEYKSLTGELIDLTRKTTQLDKLNLDEEVKAGTKNEYERQFEDRNRRRYELEEKYGLFLVDIAEQANRQIYAIEAKRISDRRALDEKEYARWWRTYQSTPEGAIRYAETAETINEMKDAQKYLQEARDNTSKKDEETIERLNLKYIELRASIEALTTAEKNEQSLQPTLRNEYARLLKELDKITKAKELASKTSAFELGDADARRRYDDIIAHEADVQKRISEIREGAGELLAEVERKHAFERAQQEIEITTRTEQHKLELAKRRMQQGSISMDSVNRLISKTETASNVAQEELAIRKLSEALSHLDKNSANYEETVKRLNDLIAEHRHNIKMATDAQYRANEALESTHRLRTTYEGALDFSKSTQSISEQIQAIKYLKEAREKLTVSEAGGKVEYERKIKQLTDEIKRQQNEIDKLSGKTKELRNSQRGLLNTTDQVRRALMGLFSVSAIKNYVSQLMRVSGELEMQRLSLQALLQNKDEADKLWAQTLQLALRSPYQITQLTRSTKQLAAYRIETEKLYETNKMLADIASGVGVEIERLILAFGQVKAANYLRGTELRQFSEAGINILGELSKYFEEVEGRAVSVGEVFERVSRRMVSFADVEEVLHRVTSQGGVFYNMQEVQAQSLRGYVSNLKDQISVMFNEIGENNDSILKWGVSFFADLAKNWQSVADVLLPTISAIIARWGIMKLTMVDKSMFSFLKTFIAHIKIVQVQLTRGAYAAKRFAVATKTTVLGGWTTAIMATVAALAIVIGKIKSAREQIRKLNKIEIEGKTQATLLAADYKRLAEEATDVTKTYTEQQKALSILKDKYRDIVPDRLLDIENLKNIKETYEEASRAIYDYIAAKTQEKKIQTVQEEEGEELIDREEILLRRLSNIVSRKLGIKLKPTDIKPVLEQYRVEVEKDLEDGIKNYRVLYDKFYKLLEQHTGFHVDSNGMMPAVEALRKYINALYDYTNAVEDITPSTFTEFGDVAIKNLTDVRENFSNTKTEFEKMVNSILQKPDDEVALNWLTEYYSKTLKREAPKWEELANDPFSLKSEIAEANVALWEAMISEMGDIQVNATALFAKENFIERMKEELEEFKPDDFNAKVINAATSLSTSMHVTTQGLAFLFKSAEESQGEYIKRIETKLEEFRKNVSEFDYQSLQSVGYWGPFELSQIETQRAQIPFIEAFLRLFNPSKSPGGGGQKDTRWSDLIKVIEDVNREFGNLNKTLDITYSKEGVMAKFADALNNVLSKVSIDGKKFSAEEFMDSFDLTTEEGMKKILDKISDIAPAAADKLKADLAKAEIIWDANIKQSDEANERIRRDIEDLFSGYELSIELGELNIPASFAEEYFDISAIELPDLRHEILEKYNLSRLSDLANESIYNTAEYKSMSEDNRKALRGDLEKIEEMEEKAQQERLKQYLQYSRDAIGERAKIKLEELKELQEIEHTFAPDDPAKQKAISRVREESYQKDQKQQWEDFQKSDLFVSLFSDLDNASEKLLSHSLAKLQEFKEQWKDMPLEDMRSIVDKIEQLELQLAATGTPFKTSKELRKERAKDVRTDEQIQADNIEEYSSIESAKEEMSLIEQILQLKEEGKELDAGLLANEMDRFDLSEATSDELRDRLATQRNIIATNEQDIANNNRTLGISKRIKKADEERSAVLSESLKLANSLYDAFSGLAEALGADADSPAMVFADMGMQMAQTVIQTVMLQIQLQSATVGAMAFGMALNTAMGIIGWIVMAVQLLTMGLTAIFKIHDNSLQKQIEELQERVESLQKAYERLSEAIENAFSVEKLNKDLSELNKNTEEQIENYRQMIELERAKKKTDSDKIKDWEEEIAQMKQDLIDTYEQSFHDVTGNILEDIIDVAETFVDKWHEAFVEVGYGMSGLEGSFDEMLLSMIKKQAAMSIVGPMVEQYLSWLREYINPEDNDLTLEAEEARAWAAKVRSTFPELNAALENMFNGFTDIMGGSAGDLSDLSKGIQGVTESTAQVIEAYLNSVRFYVADSNAKLTSLVNHIMNDSQETNPMLGQLRIISQQTSAIRALLDGIMYEHPTLGGKGLKVVV